MGNSLGPVAQPEQLWPKCSDMVSALQDNGLDLVVALCIAVIAYHCFILLHAEHSVARQRKLPFVNASIISIGLIFILDMVTYALEGDGVISYGSCHVRVFYLLSMVGVIVIWPVMIFHLRASVFRNPGVRYSLAFYMMLLPAIEILYDMTSGDVRGVFGFLNALKDEFPRGSDDIPTLQEVMLDLIRVGYFFSVALSFLQYYGELVRQWRSEATARQEPKLDELSIDRAIFVFSVVLSAVVAMALSGVNLVGLGVFSGLVGAGLSLAFRDLLNNLVAGLILLWDKSLEVGDVISTEDGWTGEIRNITMRYTLLGDRNEVEMLIPNSMLISGSIRNLTREIPEVRLGVKMRIGLSEDFRQAINIMEAACVNMGGRVSQKSRFKPKGFLLEHTSEATILEIRFWISDAAAGIANIKSDVAQRVTEALEAEGFYRPVPVYRLSVDEQLKEEQFRGDSASHSPGRSRSRRSGVRRKQLATSSP